MSLTPQDHAKFSASGSHRWMACPGSIKAEEGLPDRSSSYAEEGTVYHEIMARVLKDGSTLDPSLLEGCRVLIVDGKYKAGLDWEPVSGKDGNVYEVGKDMIDHVYDSIDVFDSLLLPGALTFIEERVDFSHAIGVPDSFGTSDVIIADKNHLIICDLKYGMGVQVDAEENSQLMLYALGALQKLYRKDAPPAHITLVVHQPRLAHLSTWTCSYQDLQRFAAKAKAAAKLALGEEPERNPGEKQCRFCKAKTACSALQNQVLAAIADDFVDLDDEESAVAKLKNGVDLLKRADTHRLSTLMKMVPLIEMFSKAVREQVFLQLSGGHAVRDFKLVRGKQGNRKWKSEKAVALLMDMILSENEMYERALISVAEAEKKIGKNSDKWKMFTDLIDRAPGKLSVAPMDDDRPAETSGDVRDDFATLEGEE